MQRVNCLKCITTISLYLWIPVTRIRKYVNTLNTKNDRVKTVLQGFNLSSLFTFEWCNSGAVTKVPPPFVNTNQWRADQGVNTHDCLYQVTCENILLSERVLGTRQLIKHKMSKMQPHKLFKFFFAFFSTYFWSNTTVQNDHATLAFLFYYLSFYSWFQWQVGKWKPATTFWHRFWSDNGTSTSSGVTMALLH